MKAAFPEHEIPSFLMLEIDENSEKYKHDIRIYRKISKEIKNFKNEEKLNKKMKARVNEELKTIQIALRQSCKSRVRPLNSGFSDFSGGPLKFITTTKIFQPVFQLFSQIKNGIHCWIRKTAINTLYDVFY